jgi:drug/metabolite transporter (DMT)-like permease
MDISGFSVLLGTFIAVFFFKETITKIDIFAIIAIIIGIVILGQKRASVNL